MTASVVSAMACMRPISSKGRVPRSSLATTVNPAGQRAVAGASTTMPSIRPVSPTGGGTAVVRRGVRPSAGLRCAPRCDGLDDTGNVLEPCHKPRIFFPPTGALTQCCGHGGRRQVRCSSLRPPIVTNSGAQSHDLNSSTLRRDRPTATRRFGRQQPLTMQSQKSCPTARCRRRGGRPFPSRCGAGR